MFRLRLLLVLGFAAVLTVALPASSDQSIAVSSTAVASYVRPLAPGGGFKPESYVFAQGQFFDGSTVDHSLEKAKFADITKTLVGNLTKQNYFPTADAANADLLIMVHWGTTTIYEDPQKDFELQAAQEALTSFNAAQEASGLADPTALNQATGMLAAGQESTMAAINRNAVLLGYERALTRERKSTAPTNAEITMLNELGEERYFVILMAYDNHVRTKDHKSKLLWVTRLSIRSPGNNFTEAMPALAKVGSEVFGQQRDDLVRIKTRRGTVKLGELEFEGTVDTTPPPPAKPEKTDK